MKIKDINNLISETLYKEVKNKIIKESDGSKKEVYHIKCEGIPLESYGTEEEAKDALNKLKHKHKGELIIEKGVYESHSDMIEKLDELNDQLEEENTNTDMKNIEQHEGNSFTDALNTAKENGDKTFEVDGKTYDVKECLEEMDMYEEECNECGEKSMEEQGEDDYLDSSYEDRTHLDDEPGSEYHRFHDTDDYEDDDDDDYEEENDEYYKDKDDVTNDFDDETKHQYEPEPDFKQEYDDLYGGDESYADDDMYAGELYEEGKLCSECGMPLNEEGVCNECSGLMWEEDVDGINHEDSKEENPLTKDKRDLGKSFDDFKTSLGMDGDKTPSKGNRLRNPDEPKSSNLKDFFSESKNKKLRLTESEFKKLLQNIVSEAMKGEPGIPGIPGVTITKKAQSASKKENDGHVKDVEKKMKDYLNFDGNDNPEFPKQIGKGEKVARVNTEQQDEEKDKNFAGLQNLDYDVEPSDKFKERLKMAIHGDSKMGNAASKDVIKVDEKEKKGKQPDEKLVNTIENPNAIKKLDKQIKNRKADKDKRALYRKQSVPVSHDTGKDEVNESKKDNLNVIDEEISRMKRLSTYNKKTQ